MTLLLLCLVPALAALRGLEKRAGGAAADARLGSIFGATAMASALWWLPLTIWRYHPPLIGLVVPALAALAIMGAALFAAIGWLRRRTGLPFPLLAAMTWICLEWFIARREVFDFPWFTLGIAVAGVTPLAQLADVGGAHGLSALLVAACAALGEALVLRTDRRASRARLLAVCAGLIAALGYGEWRMATLTLRPAALVAVVSTDIGANEKWDSQHGNRQVDRLIAMSRLAAVTRPALIAWPEVAVPGVLQDHRPWDSAIAELAAATRTPVLAGALDHTAGAATSANAAFFYEAGGGRARSAYHKRALVPFVERFSGVGAGRAAPMFPAGRDRFGVLICYESAFGELARDYRIRGAAFLVNMANDAWYAGAGGPSQGLAHLRLRAIEQRMGIVRVANGGPSGFIDPAGRFTRGAAAVVTTVSGVTFATRAGDWVSTMAVACTAVLLSLGLLFPNRSARYAPLFVTVPPAPARQAPEYSRSSPGY